MDQNHTTSTKLSILNPDPIQIPGPSLFHHLVQSACAFEALEHLEDGARTSHTYGDLHLAADTIASQISAACGQLHTRQNIVPVLIEQSPLLYASLLGTLKSGSAFCPLNADAPPDRVRFILQDVEAKVLLVSEDLASKIPENCSVTVIVAKWNTSPPENWIPSRVASPADLAYVMYTSGSTGTPKGVGIPHSSATQALLAHDRHVPSFSRFLQFAAPTFDVSVFEIFFPLFRGSTLVSVRRSELLNDLPAAMREMNIDACELTPSVAGSLLRTRENVPSLKLVLTIGEMLSEPVVRHFGGNESQESILWGMYGPTEATIHCTLQPAMHSTSTVNNIGVPLDTVSCFIVEPAKEDQSLGTCKILPIGEIGELAVGGHQLATGYLNRPEQTAKAFIETPYGRLYRTGDKARLTSDGTLECFGRLSDGQVKLRGQRLELGEVESAIMRTPGCHGAVALVEMSILIAFCAVDDGVSKEDLLRSCKRWLPQYMVPGELIVVSDFPRLPSGKANKRKLREDYVIQKSEQTRNEPLHDADDELSLQVSAIVSEVLDTSIDGDNRYANAGLDSLSAIRLASSLHGAGFGVTTIELLNLRTVSQLVSLIRTKSRDPSSVATSSTMSLLADYEEIASENIPLREVKSLIEDISPSTPLQSAMLAETMRQEGAYWNTIELETDPEATTHNILTALRKVIERNDILRTGFVAWRGGFSSVLFMGIQPEQVCIVDEFDHKLPPSKMENLLQTMHVQITTSKSGLRMLMHLHHAIYDGWSLDMLLSDLSVSLRGLEIPTRPSFRQVTGFYMHVPQTGIDRAQKFWTDHLFGWNKAPFPKLIGQAGVANDTLVAKDTLDLSFDALSGLADQLDCSIQVFFQAALSLVWSGIIGSTDVVLGTATSGRAIPVSGIHTTMGPCVASMPLRVNLDQMTENVHLINHIHSSNRAMMEHYAISLSEVKKLAGLQAGDTLYDLLFVYQESPDSDRERTKAVREVWHMDRLETKFVLEVEPRTHGFSLQATYHSSSFSKQLVAQILAQLKVIVRHIIEKPRGSIQADRLAISAGLSVYNEAPSTFEGTPDLVSMVEAAAERTPESEAICFSRINSQGSFSFETINYLQLNHLSNRIAHYMRDAGVKTGDVVAIVMEKSIRLYASILAIVKAGCAYLPLLPSTPTARVEEIFSQARIQFCFSDPQPASSLIMMGDNVRVLGIEEGTLTTYPHLNLSIQPDGSRLSYVIYTSGTTGKPKGVAVTQLNAASNIAYLEAIYPKSKGKQSRFLQACSQAFDVSVFEIFYAWHAGMCLCSGTNDTLFQDLEESIRQLEITHLSLTPTVASMIDPKNVPDVEFLVTAGEPMTRSVQDRWGELLWQGYGPSETTNICSVKHMTRNDYIEHLGWVFPNTSIFVLFPKLLDVAPVGWVGEFCFGGDQVAHGYLNLPETTLASFIEHPDYGRIYRSGDMGRMLPDGSLVILGRIDTQLKLRGQRIEAGEVNSVITSTDLSSAAVTILARRKEKFPEQLVTFYTPLEDHSEENPVSAKNTTAQLLFSTLQTCLPPYMVPSYLIQVSTIPQTASGKVDHRKLRRWFGELSPEALESSAQSRQEMDDGKEWSETELVLEQIISIYLNSPDSKINRWTPFATIGIDSISAIGLARELGKRLARSIPISAILQNPSVVQLGRYVDSQQMAKAVRKPEDFFSKSLLSDIRKDFEADGNQVEAILPCTPLQEAMLAGGHQSYYNKVMLRLFADQTDMRKYWQTITRRHGILRTAFMTTNQAVNSIAQVVLRERNIPWLEFSVSTPSFDHVVHEHLKQLPEPVDSRMPPVSLAVINYRSTAFLSFICHHALYDGVAMSNLWREIEALANGRALLPAISYEPFLMESLALPNDTEGFWSSQLRGFQPLSLFRKSRSRSSVQASKNLSLTVPLREIYDLVQSLGISVLSLCEAAWANTIAIASSSPDVCFGNVVSGRTVDIEGIERLVAPCFNTVPIRKDTSNHAHGIDMAKYFYQLSSEILQYQFTPLRLVQKISDRQGRGLFDTLLIVQQPLDPMDDRVWIFEADSGEMDVPLVCEVVPCPSLNSVVVNMLYDMDAISEEIVSTFAEIFSLQIESVLRSPYEKLLQRDSLPRHLQKGLEGVVVKQERPELGKSTSFLDEVWEDSEAQIRAVLSALSGISETRITRSTSIFHLGLDSINAVQVASMLRRQGLDASASDVIECNTCAKIAERIRENSGKNSRSTLSYDLEKYAQDVAQQVREKVPDDNLIEAILPCTSMQAAMITSFIQSSGDHYLNLIKFSLEKGTKTMDVVEAWGALERSHPMLRTGFSAVNHPDASFAMVRFAALACATPVTIVKDGEEGIGNRCIDLRAQFLQNQHLPPWHVFVEGEEECISMSLMIHHALYDADSLDSILEQLAVQVGDKYSVCHFANVEPSLTEMMTNSKAYRSEAEEFWKQLAPKTVVNKFPIMTPLREDERALRTEMIQSSMTCAEFQDATQRAGITPQAVFQAAWARILSSYLGESSVSFGVTLSSRATEATKDAPMPCLATLPIIASNQSSNGDILNYMMDLNTKCHKFQSVPLSQVQNWLGHPASPVFDTLLSYRKIDEQSKRPRPFSLAEDDARVDYPVSIEIEAVERGEVRLSITYSPSVVPQEQAKLMLQQFNASACYLATNPNGDDLDLYKTEQSLFSVAPPLDPEMTTPVQYMHQFVELGARTQPDSTALEFVSGFFDNGEPIKDQWTYRELDHMGNRVANMLASEAAVGSIVAIHFDKCPEAYFSILGILKAGCSFVALDPAAPKARKEFILSDSKAPCVLTNAAHLGLDSNVKIIPVSNRGLEEAFDTAQRELGPEFSPSSTCYCLYTSGTTGTPKGCEITHENAVQAMMAFQYLFKDHWEADSRWLQFASLHFDVSVLEQYWSWSVGITLVGAPKDLILDDLTGTINKLGITHIDLTPSLARLTHPDEVPSLCRGVFITGGESLKQEILDVWGPKAVIYNAYGPTEATIGVTTYQRVPVNGRPSNIGKQFPNVGSYVFHPGTEIPVLRGGVGELCVSGKLVGKGYLGRPELTQERFPVLEEYGERIYRTGDLVRLLYDGCFDFLGRADDQVKLRGQRLEIGEINHAIRGVPEISDTATIVTSRDAKDKSVLVSFVVSAEVEKEHEGLVVLKDSKGLGSKAKDACRQSLPGYMVPTYCFAVPYIPLSPNNKAEVKELKRLFQELSHEQLMENTAAVALPQSGPVRQVCDKIIQCLAEFGGFKESDIWPTSSIFDLGVDSISALRLAALLKSKGLKGASTTIILRNPVVVELAQSISASKIESNDKYIREAKQTILASQHRYRATACRVLNIKPDEIEYTAPCSPLQQGIISKALTSEGEGAYFNSFELNLREGISEEKLRQAWEGLVAAEPVLRTVFLSMTSGHVQVALKNKKSPWETRQFQSKDDSGPFLKGHRDSWIAKNSEAVIEPLQLIYLNIPGQSSLVVNIFHAIYDGNSLELMLNQVSSRYLAKEIEPSPSFLDALAHGPLWKFDHSREFWMGHFRDWSKPAPLVLSEPSLELVTAATKVFSYRGLDSLRKAQKVTLQSVMLALWTSVINSYYTDSVALGIVLAGRSIDLAGADRVVGPLFNTIPFLNKSVSGETWSSLIQKCHKFGVDTLPFQHVSLQKIQKWCSNGQPLFDILFTLQLEEEEESTQSSLWESSDGASNPDYPLAIEIRCTRNFEMRVLLLAQGSVAQKEVLESILNQMEKNLALMVANAEQVVSYDVKNRLTAPLESRNSPVVGADGGNEQSDFHWDDTAMVMRQEAAILSGTNPGEIQETTPVFELGLDSIDIIKLSAKLSKRGIKIPASGIIRLQTIARMAKFYEESNGNQPTLAKSINLDEVKRNLAAGLRSQNDAALDWDTVETVLPPTALQESMVASMICSDYQWYFNHDFMEIQHDVVPEKMRQAWVSVVQALPVLRTGFYEIDDPQLDFSYCQVVKSQLDLQIDDVSLDSLEDMGSLIERAKDRARQGNGKDGLIQLVFVTIGEKKYLLLSLAHALYDGWSIGLVYQLLQRIYNGGSFNTISSESFIQRTLEAQGSESKEFWSDYLQDATPSILSGSMAGDEATGISRIEKISTPSAEAAQAFCQKYAISLQVLCQACWAIVLAHQTRQLDVVFGMVMSGRDFEGAEDLVFPTMNTVAVRCILHGSVQSFVQYLEENMGDIREYQALPLRKAQQSARVMGQLFDTLFMLQKSLGNESQDSLLKSVDGTASVDYPFSIEAEVVDGTLTWRSAYQSQAFSDETVATIMQNLDQVLAFMLEGPDLEVLSYDEGGTSICGLPSVPLDLESTDQQDLEAVQDAENDNETWDERSSAIRRVLSEVSGISVEQIKLSNSLYHLGLDSISAIKVSTMLRRQSISVSVRDLISAENIRELAVIAPNMPGHRTPQTEPTVWNPSSDIDIDDLLQQHEITKSNVQVILPAISLQVFMLGTWQNSEGRVFFPEFAYELKSSCSQETVYEAWKSVVRSTPMLRTHFIATSSRDVPVLQIIMKAETEISNPWVELSIQRNDNETWRLKLKIHHALYDGVSLPALMEKLAHHIQSVDDFAENSDHLRVWSDFSIHLSQEEAQKSRKQFWSDYFNGVQPTPTSTPSSTERVSLVQRAALKDISSLRQHAARHGVSIQSLFFAAYAKVLASQQTSPEPSHVVFGIYLANRGDENDSELATFPRLNLIPIKVALQTGDSLASVAAEVQRNINQVTTDGRADVGLWEIEAWTGLKVNSFVNFLSLPTSNDDVDAAIIAPIENMAQVADTSKSDVEVTRHIGDVSVRNAFPSAIDIEASVRGDALDMGAFSAKGVLDDEAAAQSLLDDIISILETGIIES